ncbi:ABC transporter ATP-binding protein [Sulfuracidifex metallicus]|uniref:ABC transporter ATP-binding protein n=1 Tax=Sulfuracidifex metallicus TaxID=47303 RepID=UPI0022762F80|nr:ABC transporter ATP-binding protein [Sulfuracidifex metallicus]MCY0850345.1 ABC transporter ATP-binding protein [Sulfuracidifex metallicus]
MIEGKSIKVKYKLNGKDFLALKGTDITVGKGEIVGLAGESGSGKTTLGRAILALQKFEGEVLWNGKNVLKLKGDERMEFRKKNQIVYQDPFDAVDIRMKVFDIIAEGLRINHMGNREEIREKVLASLKTVGLNPPETFANVYPTQLSGGQLQRVAIARAIVMEPEFIVADEPVSMLDMSIRAGILEIFNELKAKGTSTLMITHDLSTVAFVSDRIYVLYLGKMVESGLTSQIVENPKHPYTQALISSIPVPEPGFRVEAKLKDEDSPPPPRGCPLYPRCPFRMDKCKDNDPGLVEVEPGHRVACYLY